MSFEVAAFAALHSLGSAHLAAEKLKVVPDPADFLDLGALEL